MPSGNRTSPSRRGRGGRGGRGRGRARGGRPVPPRRNEGDEDEESSDIDELAQAANALLITEERVADLAQEAIWN